MIQANIIVGPLFSSADKWQRSFSNAELSVVHLSVYLSVHLSVCPSVKIEEGGGGQSQKRFSNFFSFLA